MVSKTYTIVYESNSFLSEILTLVSKHIQKFLNDILSYLKDINWWLKDNFLWPCFVFKFTLFDIKHKHVREISFTHWQNCMLKLLTFLKTQLQSLDIFYAWPCVLFSTLWYIKILVYFYEKHYKRQNFDLKFYDKNSDIQCVYIQTHLKWQKRVVHELFGLPSYILFEK